MGYDESLLSSLGILLYSCRYTICLDEMVLCVKGLDVVRIFTT